MQARVSALSKIDNYETRHDWPCFVQCGDGGIVFLTKGGSYRTAFFEAFPRNPDTFIRGEGKTVAEAEEECWAKWQKITACPGHEWERRGYKNGGCFCKHCNLFMVGVLEPDEACCICGKPTYYTHDVDDNFYCEAHVRDKPLEKWDWMDWHVAYSEYAMAMWDRGLEANWENTI